MVGALRALDRKLLRDLWRLRGQILAIGLVIASGVAVLVMSLTSVEALQSTAKAYYERYRFADVFAQVERAPDRLVRPIAEIPGVQTVETSITKFAILDVPGFVEPIIGQLVSVPENNGARLNRLALRAGRHVEAGRPDEVILNEAFAEAHGLDTGDRLSAILNGRKRQLTVVGIALSPEFVYAIGPGQLMPDDHRFGILWMGREALEAAFDLDGAFNAVALSLLRGADAQSVIERLDLLLDRYGGVGAVARADQLSNWFLMNEIEQLKTMARVVPAIFLTVAAFLANFVLARLIATERAEIGLMKAFGYGNLEVGWHYAKMVMVMAGVGILFGWAAGAWLGRFNTQIYADLFHFPFLLFRPAPTVFIAAGAISLAAALLGTMTVVWRAVRLPPAEAMQPPAPPLYRRAGSLSAGLLHGLDQPTRIIFRQITRWPGRAMLTSLGTALAVAVLVMALQWLDAIDRMVSVQFHDAQRQDVTLGLVESESEEIVREIARLPGVLATEPGRWVSATFRSGPLRHKGSIQGVVTQPMLNLVYDNSGRALSVPAGGLLLSTMLARKLDVEPGESVWVEIHEGRQPRVEVPVLALFESYFGMTAYMNLGSLSALLKEAPRVDQVELLVDWTAGPALYAELKTLPEVSAIVVRRATIDTFYETMGETLMIFVSFFVAFACSLAVGVVYNSTRITLSERGRELATLRVLGFGPGEIAYILLGQVGLLVLVGLPLGCGLGYGLAWVMVSSMETELFRVPLVVEPATYGWSVVIALAAAAGSAAVVGRRLARLDLIAVLKTRE